MAFKIAGSMAIKEALRQAHSVILEPIMRVDVVVPDDYIGNVIGDLNSRRGQIQNQETEMVPFRLLLLFRFLRCSVTPMTFVPRPWAAASM